MMRDYFVAQGPEPLAAECYFHAESAVHAAAKLAILIPLRDWDHVGGTRYRLTLRVTDRQTSEQTVHTFVADVKAVAQ